NFRLFFVASQGQELYIRIWGHDTAVSGNTEFYVRKVYNIEYKDCETGENLKQNMKYHGVSCSITSEIPDKSYVVTFNAGSGSCSERSREVAVPFREWNTSGLGTGSVIKAGDTVTENRDLVLYALWNDVAMGALPVPSRPGYSFAGWFTEEGTEVKETTLVASDMTVYAKYLEIYSIQFNANGGKNAPSDVSKIEGTDIMLPDAVPEKSYQVSFTGNGKVYMDSNKSVSCTFKDWNTDPEGKGTSYAGNGKYSQDGNAVLYAQWKNPVIGTMPEASKWNYKFIGWYTDRTGGTKVTENTTVSSDVTLYARYEMEKLPHAVSKEAHVDKNEYLDYVIEVPSDGRYIIESTGFANVYAYLCEDELMQTQMMDYSYSGSNSNFKIEFDAKAGEKYYLRAWIHLQGEGDFELSFRKAYKITYMDPQTSGIMKEAWKRHDLPYTMEEETSYKIYTVTYDSGEGTCAKSSATRNAYFKEWNTSSQNNGTVYKPEDEYTGNAELTVYGVWAVRLAALPDPDPVRTGFYFSGWYFENGKRAGAEDEIISDTTLYARYSDQVRDLKAGELIEDTVAAGERKVYRIPIEASYDGFEAGASGSSKISGALYTSIELSKQVSGHVKTSTFDSFSWLKWFGSTGKPDAVYLVVSNTDTSSSESYRVGFFNVYNFIFKERDSSSKGFSIRKKQGETITMPEVPSDYGYRNHIYFNAMGGSCGMNSKVVYDTFKEWNTRADGTGISYHPGDIITAEDTRTFYAVWDKPFIGTLPEASLDGHTFIGWFTRDIDGSMITESTRFSNNDSITAYAHYENYHTSHEPEIRNAREATTESEGYTGDTYCSICGKQMKKGSIIPMIVHIWDSEYTIDQEATCTEDGSKSIHCSHCDEKKEVTIIPATGHTEEEDPGIKATCVSEGMTSGSHCRICSA
ncbi:MAG: InlB B-repeat-containing protein, partial [Parasporobacterium sp.]|nr:InlB B-repeat-containing protein [Blautia sp.]MCF0229853.1 InlB B-repeat-containing protein [Parasporobacterium sp.]